MLYRLLPTFALLSASLLAQIPSEGVTVTVTRVLPVTAATELITVQLSTPATATLEQIVEAFAPVGLKAEDLVQTGIFAGPSPETTNVNYTFNIPAGREQIGAMTTRLVRIRNANDWILGLTAHTPSVSSNAPVNWDAQRKTVLPEMMAEARARAQEIANMAGLRLGHVLAIQDPSSMLYPNAVVLGRVTATVYLTVRFNAQPF